MKKTHIYISEIEYTASQSISVHILQLIDILAIMDFLGTELDCWDLYGFETHPWKRFDSQTTDTRGTTEFISSIFYIIKR